MSTLSLIQSDYKKYKKYGSNGLTIIFLTQGFWATFQYRIANSIHRRITIQPFRILFLIPMFIWQKIIEITTGISIPGSVTIGHSFYIAHFGNIILNSKTIIGNNCNFSQGVTIGVSGTDFKRGVPKIGDNVYIGANSVVAGKIVIGNNVLIGACSLVTIDLHNDAIAIGVPAKIISDKSSKGYI